MIRLQSQKKSNVILFEGHSESSGTRLAEESDLLYPIDPRTGLPMSDTGKLMSFELSPVEKEKIIQRLQEERGTFMPSELSDEDLFDLLPPRYLTGDPVDVQLWRDYLGEYVLPEMDNKVASVLEEASVGDSDYDSGDDSIGASVSAGS